MQQLLVQLKAVAETTRLRLLAICARAELSVSEITEILGQSQPRVSRHLKLLCDAGLLDRYREQHWVLYRVAARGEGARAARQLLAMLPENCPELADDRERIRAVLSDRDQLVTRIIATGPKQLEAVAEIGAHGEAVDRAILDILGEFEPGDLLDIGTGSGRMLALLADKASHAVGIDISRDMLLVARSNLRAAGVKDVSVRQGDMYRLRYAPQSFDTVTMDLVLSHAEQPGRVVAEATRVLKPGGVLLVVDFFDEDAGLASGQPDAWLQDAGFETLARSAIRVGKHELGLWLARAGAGHNIEAA